MQITVSLTIDLPASGDVDMLEAQIIAAGRQAMAEALRLAAIHYQAQVDRCPACQAVTLQADGVTQRVVLTSLGRVDVPGQRLRCTTCTQRVPERFRARAAFFAPLSRDNVTAALGQVAALAGASWSYTTAARVLHDVCGAQISPEAVRQRTNQRGTCVAHHQLEAAERLLAPTAADIRAEQTVGLVRPSASSVPALVLVGLDGGWVPSRAQVGGMEGKVAVVATGVEAINRERQRLYPRR